MAPPLTTDMNDRDQRPYFLWDEGITVGELQEVLASGDETEKTRLLAKTLREARDDEVWHFTTVRQVLDLWPKLAPRLGRRRAFWEFLIDAWRRQGLVAQDPQAGM